MKPATPFHHLHAFGNAGSNELVVTASRWGEEVKVHMNLRSGEVKRWGDRTVGFDVQRWLRGELCLADRVRSPLNLPELEGDSTPIRHACEYGFLLQGAFTADHLIGLYCLSQCSPREEVVELIQHHVEKNAHDMPVSEMLCTQQALEVVGSKNAFINKWLQALLTHVCVSCRTNGFSCLTASAQCDAAVTELAAYYRLRCNVCDADRCFTIARARRAPLLEEPVSETR